MIISIEMGADLSKGQNPKILLISPSKKRYELDASVSTYGNRLAVGINIPLMKMSAETEGIVANEEGEFRAMATIEMDKYRLNSDVITVRLDGVAVPFEEGSTNDLMKVFQAANRSDSFVSPIGQVP